jgi:O-antigen/teichoic acid export membrane protein
MTEPSLRTGNFPKSPSPVFSFFGLSFVFLTAQVATYLLSLIAVRNMSSQDFGLLASVTAVVGVVTTIGGGLQFTIATKVRPIHSDGNHLCAHCAIKYSKKHIVLTSILVAVIAIPASYIFRADYLLVFVGLLVAVPTISSSGLIGITQGIGKIKIQALAILVPVLFRLSGATLFALTRQDLFTFILFTLVGATLGLIIILSVVPKAVTFSECAIQAVPKSIKRLQIKQTFTTLGMAVLLAVDLILSRWLLPIDEAGAYSAGNLITKMSFFIPAVLLYLAIPKFSSPYPGKALATSTLSTFAIGASFCLLVYSQQPLFLKVLGENNYKDLLSQLHLFAISGLLLSLIQVFAYFLSTRGRKIANLIIFCGVLLSPIAALYSSPQTNGSLVKAMIAIQGLLLIGLTLASAQELIKSKEKPSATA